MHSINDIIRLVDGNINIVVRHKYDGYGNIISAIRTLSYEVGIHNPFRYKGYYYDSESDLYYLNSRYYNPELSRFISHDSIKYLEPESVNGLNLYVYCYNNPIFYSDPSGNLPQWAEWLIGGVVIVGLGIATVFTGVAAGVILGAAFYGAVTSAVGRYSEIHLNRSKGLGIKGFRPDVTGVTKNGLRVVEVVSSSQTYASQVAKVVRMMGQYSHISNGLTLDALRFITSWFLF